MATGPSTVTRTVFNSNAYKVASELSPKVLGGIRFTGLGWQFFEIAAKTVQYWTPESTALLANLKEAAKKWSEYFFLLDFISVVGGPVEGYSDVLTSAEDLTKTDLTHSTYTRKFQKYCKDLVGLIKSVSKLAVIIMGKLKVVFTYVKIYAPLLGIAFAATIFVTDIVGKGISMTHQWQDWDNGTEAENSLTHHKFWETGLEVAVAVVPGFLYLVSCATFLPFAAMIPALMLNYQASVISHTVYALVFGWGLRNQYVDSGLKLEQPVAPAPAVPATT